MREIVWFCGNEGLVNRRMISGLAEVVRKNNWNLSVLPRPAAIQDIKKALEFWKPDAVVTDVNQSLEMPRGVHVCALGARPRGYRGRASFIYVDAAEIAELAAKELISLGYGNYAFIAPRIDTDWSLARESEFKRILALHGLDCRVFRATGKSAKGDAAYLKSLKKFIAGLPRPCAVFAACDRVGTVVLDVTNALDIAVPRDIAVCSVDDNEEICLNTTPQLTSVGVDFESFGRLTGEEFARMFANQKVKPRVIVRHPRGIVRRSSTRAFAAIDPIVAKVREFIRERVTGGVTAHEAAALFPCSLRMAEIRFKNATGNSIMEEIVTARMEAAMAMMSRSDMSLAEIASASGWPSQRLLRREFKIRYGKTPSEWRKK